MSFETLGLVESLDAGEASSSRLFGNEGVSFRAMGARRRNNAGYMKKLTETADMLAEAMAGNRRALFLLKEALLQESQSTSDFPLLLGDVLDRQLLAHYQEAPSSWQEYCKRTTVADFREVKRFDIKGAMAVLPKVEQGADYTERGLSETKHSHQVNKYGCLLPFLWELIINDDLGAFKDVPMRFGRAARRSIDKFATELHVDTNGPHASFYTSGNANIITGNPAFSLNGLRTAVNQALAMTDSDGEPIMNNQFILEVGPQLMVDALGVANALQIELNENGGNTNSRVITTNWTQSMIRVVVNYYIPIVAATRTAAGKYPWFLHADSRSGRAALEISFLRGHEEPEIFQKAPNSRRLGGGGGDVLEDFENDAINHKVRFVFGGGRQDPKLSLGSNGTDGA